MKVMMEALQQKLKEVIEPIGRKQNIFLFDIQIKGDRRQLLVMVIVDTETGITLGECQRFSGEVSDIIFRENLISQAYRLEVSSPGVDKPLQFPYEFRRNIGRNLQVIFDRDGIRKEIKGELAGYEEDKIKLRTGKEFIIIPVDKIEKANVKLNW
jgi:ribosome maturation factor RimP